MQRTLATRFPNRQLLAACLLAAAALAAAPAAARAQAPDRTATLVPTEPFAWESATQTGITGETTLAPYPGDSGDCDTPNERCDRTLLQVAGRPAHMIVDIAIVSGGVNSYFGDDLDLVVYESDAAGTVGERVAESSNGESEPEHVAIREPRGWYLVHVVWSWAVQSSFRAIAVSGGETYVPATEHDELVPALTAATNLLSPSLPALLKRGLPVLLSCSTDCEAEITLVADRRTARRAKLPVRSVATGRLVLARPGVGTLRLRANPAARRRLRRVRVLSGTLTASIRNRAGLRTRVSQPVQLRRPGRG